MPPLSVTFEFTRGSAPASRIEEVAREILDELNDPDSEASGMAQRAGLNRTELLDAQTAVTEGEHGADPFLTPIIVGIIANVGSTAAEALWEKVLWPRIRRRLGADAIGEQKVPAKDG
ncbi:MAG: hypothetical protein JO100_00285 [Pseudonocardia sp.]|nr:hypothetical protein [Pseudonocardia sp.]